MGDLINFALEGESPLGMAVGVGLVMAFVYACIAFQDHAPDWLKEILGGALVLFVVVTTILGVLQQF